MPSILSVMNLIGNWFIRMISFPTFLPTIIIPSSATPTVSHFPCPVSVSALSQLTIISMTSTMYGPDCAAHPATWQTFAPPPFSKWWWNAALMLYPTLPTMYIIDRSSAKHLAKSAILFADPSGAFYLFFKAPFGITAEEFMDLAIEHHVFVVPAGSFTPRMAETSSCVSSSDS